MSRSDSAAKPSGIYASAWVPVWIWLAGAIFTWAVSIVGALFTASAIADLPQPNQQLWINVVAWSGVLPMACAAITATTMWARRRPWRLVVLGAAHTLLWSSAVLIFLWIPKAP